MDLEKGWEKQIQSKQSVSHSTAPWAYLVSLQSREGKTSVWELLGWQVGTRFGVKFSSAAKFQPKGETPFL